MDVAYKSETKFMDVFVCVCVCVCVCVNKNVDWDI